MKIKKILSVLLVAAMVTTGISDTVSAAVARPAGERSHKHSSTTAPTNVLPCKQHSKKNADCFKMTYKCDNDNKKIIKHEISNAKKMGL